MVSIVLALNFVISFFIYLIIMILLFFFDGSVREVEEFTFKFQEKREKDKNLIKKI